MQHRAETVPLLDGFFDRAAKMLGKLSAKSALAAAFRYALTRREALKRFVTDGRLGADSNIAGNALRGMHSAEKTISSPGQTPAAMYTIVQTAKLNGLNPEAYLRDTLAKIADWHPISRIDRLMPWARG